MTTPQPAFSSSASAPAPGLSAGARTGGATPSYPHAAPRRPFPGTEELRAAEIFSGPGYQAPHPRTNPLAVAGLVTALLSFIPALGLIAIALGAASLRTIRRHYQTGEALAWFAIVVGSASCAFWLVVTLLVAVI
ncbi:DUF4190 domain-containing protein [Actinomyces faecalis]|uniref:DUF4190 domain-containing protein n=1 Tax=Actinomyces faecalis TaxID=2722820 RepID=UPI001FD5CA71|nr:DUF4190 domain-containing protein [Actinomyces faecalis]